MTHFVVLIIVPKYIYIKGLENVTLYINDTLYRYDENLPVEPYIVIPKIKLEKKYRKYMMNNNDNKYNTIEKYTKGYKGYDLDENGNAISTYNKDTLYDWFEIGGRWDGLFTDNKYENDLLKNNSISVEELIKGFRDTGRTYSILIDPNKNIYKDRNMYWFGLYTKNKTEEEWKKEYLDVLSKNKDHYVVNLDCHI